MYYDFHLHTSFSSDSQAPMESMIQRGIALGLPGICFTEHMDLAFPPGELNFLVDLPAYEKTCRELKEKYADTISVFFGLEMGLQPHLKDFYEGRTQYQAYHRYFEVVLENLKTFSCFDTCGHIDYVVRYGPEKNKDYSYRAYRDILDEILKTLIEKGIGLECNSAGFKYGLGHPNPTEDILTRYRELGGEILTLGSDGHAPEHMAYDFPKMGELLKACGFRYYTIFKKRKPEFIKL